jgi:hypothetical protein
MITTVNDIVNALANNSSRIIIDKAAIANQIAGGFSSLWRATGQPAQAAIPTAAAVPTSATLGAMGFANQTAPAKSYIGWLNANSSNSGNNVEIHDRLAHMGGLLFTLTTAQATTSLNLATLALPADRIGDANYSDVQWWLEVYADGGATASNATINVTYNDNTTGNLNPVAVGGTLRTGRLIQLTPLIPIAQQGKFIKGINNVTLSATTGTAGNFGFTATRPRTSVAVNLANKTETFDWAQLGLPEVPNQSCLQIIMLCITTTTGTLRGGGKIAHG